MILETTQLLNNVRIKYYPKISHIYRKTHDKHPCSIWAGLSNTNFDWLSQLGLALCKEYTYRYGKIHKCQEIIEYFSKSLMKPPQGKLTNFVQCMPDIYKNENVIEAYRDYYRNEKKYFAKWTKRSVPKWW
jgi:hypothetical protein